MSILHNRLKGPSDRRRPPRRSELTILAVGSVLLLSACASEAGQTSEPETSVGAGSVVGKTAGSPPRSETPSARGSGTDSGKTIPAKNVGSEQATASYRVPTITCPSCVARVETNAKKEPGVVDVEASLQTQKVTVTYDPKKTNPRKIADAIRSGGDTVLQGG